MPRKFSADSIYARELGVEDTRKLKRLITRLGGAEKLRSLSPEVRNLLLCRIGKKDKVHDPVEVNLVE